MIADRRLGLHDATDSAEPTCGQIMLSVMRLRRFHQLFVDTASLESESSFAMLSGWVSNLQILESSASRIEAILLQNLPEVPLQIARLSRSNLGDYLDNVGAAMCRLRFHNLAQDSDTLDFIQARVIPELRAGDELLARWIHDLGLSTSTAHCEDSPRPSTSAAVTVTSAPLKSSLHWRLSRDFAGHEARFRWSLTTQDLHEVVRALRALLLMHYAWGSVFPEDWTDDRHSRVEKAVATANEAAQSETLAARIIHWQADMLESLTRETFAEQSLTGLPAA